MVTKSTVIKTEVGTRVAVWLTAGLLRTAVTGIWNCVHLWKNLRFHGYRTHRRRNLGCRPELVSEYGEVPGIIKLDVNQVRTDIHRKPVQEQEYEQETPVCVCEAVKTAWSSSDDRDACL